MINQVILLGQLPSSVHKYSKNKDKISMTKILQLVVTTRTENS